jgi:putative intracellular protease/amidase
MLGGAGMKTYVLVYDGFVQFEIILACYFMKTRGDILTVSLDDCNVTSYEGFDIIPSINLSDFIPDSASVLIIPGGNPKPLINNSQLKESIIEMNNRGALLAAICSGPIALARAGVLNGKRFTTTLPPDQYTAFSKCIYTGKDVEIDGNIITAKANAYVDFAIETGKMLGAFRDEKDIKETIEYFKHFKDVFS